MVMQTGSGASIWPRLHNPVAGEQGPPAGPFIFCGVACQCVTKDLTSSSFTFVAMYESTQDHMPVPFETDRCVSCNSSGRIEDNSFYFWRLRGFGPD